MLRKTDFYSVSIRRNAFLVVAPQVAECVPVIEIVAFPFFTASGRHAEYRPGLIDHLILITLRHWDITMRQMGAKSVRLICEIDLTSLGPACVSRLVSHDS